MQEAYLVPEIESRLKENLITEDQDIYAYQILINVRKPVEVLINNEVRGVVKLSSKNCVGIDQVAKIDNTEIVEHFILIENDANSAHVTSFMLPNGDFGYV